MGILVIDVGTSSMKGFYFNNEAQVLSQARRSYRPVYHSSECVTQNPLILKNALFQISREIQEWCKNNQQKIHAVSLTAQRSSVIPADQDGNPLSDALMWQDKRNLHICEELKEKNKEIIRLSGTSINHVFSGSKMTWIRREKEELYKKTYKFLVVADYLLYQITGMFKTDRTYASRSHLMNLRTGQWDEELLKIFQIEKEKLCDLMDPGKCHGTVCKEFGCQTGITEGTPVYSAGGDQQCAALGMGVLNEGNLEITSGTGAFIIGMTKQLPEKFLGNPIINYSAVKGYYIVEASILTCCAAFDWFCTNFYKGGSGIDYKEINREIMQSPPGANGCMLLPFFQGRATPLWNPKATASFTNVTLSTTRGDMARAVLEGIAYEIKNNIDVVEGQIGEVYRILIGGGLSKSEAFNQIQTDVYGKRLIYYSNMEATALGAWISTAVQSGIYASIYETFQKAREKDQIIYYYPVMEHVLEYKKYRKQMNQIYRKLYETERR